MSPRPRVSFGIIVLNGEPFTRYCLRALYPFAHEIIVVEGAVASAASIATADGHSRDGTLDVLRRFKAEEDPADKVQIVTRDGFWREKDEMSQAYAERATGDYLWQVDIDEFYRAADMQAVLAMLRADPTITAVSFKMITFWGGFDYWCDSWYLRSGAEIYHRLFKWGAGYDYATHRPPTVLDDAGRNLRDVHWVDGYQLADQGIYLYHYSLLLPKQVQEKSDYYRSVTWDERSEALQWAENAYARLNQPYRVHNVYTLPGWLERFDGAHPAQIQHLRRDLEAGAHGIALRPTADIERLLDRPAYRVGRFLLKIGSVFYVWQHRFRRWLPDDLKQALKRLLPL